MDEVERPPAMQHSRLLPIILVGVVMFSVGLAVGFVLFGNKTNVASTKNQLTPGSPTARQISPTVVVVSPTSVVNQTADEAAKWKTYTNDRNKFSIMYTSDWIVTENASRIDFDNNKSSSSLTFYFQNDPDAKRFANIPITGTENLQIGNESAVFNKYTSYVVPQPSAYAYVDLLPLVGKSIESVNFHIDPAAFSQDSDTIKTVLSSFKSIN